MAIATVEIHGKRFAPLRNPDVNKPLSDKLAEYFNTAGGAFRCLQSIDRIFRFVAQVFKNIGSTIARPLEDLAGHLSKSWQFLAVPRLFDVVPRMKKAMVEWFNVSKAATPDVSNREQLEKIQEIADGASTSAYAVVLFTSNKLLKNVADVFDLVSQVSQLSMAREDWMLAKEHLQAIDANDPANVEIRDRFSFTLRNSFLRLVKSVVSVAGSVLGLMVLTMGGPTLPALAMLSLGLVSTFSALAAHFHEKTSLYEKVNFWKVRDPVNLIY